MNGLFGAIRRMSYKTKGDAWRPLTTDRSTWSLTTIPYSHHEVHSGNSYFANYQQDLTNGELMGIGLFSPQDAHLHLTLHALGTAKATLTIYEDCVELNGGISFTPPNQNRNSTNKSGTTVIYGGTDASLITRTGGNSIYSAGFTTGAPINWDRETGEEMIMKQYSMYYFEIENSVNANIASLTLRWYEHEDRDTE